MDRALPQADPVVSDPTHLQNLNRYSFVRNNPFAYTDPTGFWGHKEQGYLRTAVAAAISVYTAGTCAGAAWGAFGEGVTAGQAVAAGAIGGFTSGAVASGTAKGALLGAFTGAVGGGILQTSLAGTWGGIAVNATASGITSELNGGRFGSGFLSAGRSAVLAPHMETGNSFQDGLSAAVMGGTISAMTGGKFANGAVTAAFSTVFASVAESAVTGSGSGRVSSPSQSTDVSLVPGECGSPEAAVNAFGEADAVAARSSGSEYQTGVVEFMGSDGFGPPAYAYTKPFTGDPGTGVVPWGKYLPALQSTYGGALYGYAHVHADGNMISSLYDYNFMHGGHSPLYLYNQNRQTRMLTDTIVRSAVMSSGIQSANPILPYAQRYKGFPGACVYGCGH